MPLISSTTILRTFSIFHLTTSYLLLTSPSILLRQNLILILGSAMRLPSLSLAALVDPSVSHPAAASNPFIPGNPALALAALFLAYLAVTDLAALNMREDLHFEYWTAQAPTRLAGLLALEAYVYLSKPIPGQIAQGWGRGLQNDVVFAWGFVEAGVTFWAWLVLREERGAFIAKKKRKEQEKGT